MSVELERGFGYGRMEPPVPDTTELLSVLVSSQEEKLRRAASRSDREVHITSARSFEEARDRLEELRVDGVVADRVGRSESVFAFRESLRQRFELPPFVLLWGDRLEPEAVTRGFRRGLDGYVCKEAESSARRVLELAMEETRTLQVKRMIGFRDGIYPPLSCQILDEFPGLVLVYRPNRNLFWTNRSARRSFDLNPAVVGSRDREVLERYVVPRVRSPEDLKERLEQAYQNGAFYDRFPCLVEPDEGGAFRVLEYRSVPIRTGRLEGGRVEIFHEIDPPDGLGSSVNADVSSDTSEGMDSDVREVSTKGASIPEVLEGGVSDDGVKSLRLLVVEDDPVMARLIDEFTPESWEIVYARTTSEAENQMGEYRFDVHLIDVNLGAGTDGVTLMRRFKENERTAPTPALAVTAHAMMGDRESLLDAGFDAYLSKPFRRRELVERVRAVLESSTSSGFDAGSQ